MSALTDARATQTSIEERLSEARTDLAECDARRETLAFGALTGDTAAKKALAALDLEETRLTIAVKTAEKALKEAKRRVSQAENAERDAEERADAEAVLAAVDDFKRAGEAFAAKLAEAVKAYDPFFKGYRRFAETPFAPTTYPVVANVIRRAVSTALMEVGLAGEFLAPVDRVDLNEAVTDWTTAIRHRATERLARPALEAPRSKAA